MACRHLRFDLADLASQEWVPMALREATCMLRRSNPEKWNQVLRCRGVEVGEDEIHCMHNLEGSWGVCPLYRERQAAQGVRDAAAAETSPPGDAPQGAEQDEDDVPRNEHGYPLNV